MTDGLAKYLWKRPPFDADHSSGKHAESCFAVVSADGDFYAAFPSRAKAIQYIERNDPYAWIAVAVVVAVNSSRTDAEDCINAIKGEAPND